MKYFGLDSNTIFFTEAQMNEVIQVSSMLATQVESTQNEDPINDLSPRLGSQAEDENEKREDEDESEEEGADGRSSSSQEQLCVRGVRPIPVFSVSSPSPMGSGAESPL